MNRRLAVLLPVAVLLVGLAATAVGTTWLHMRTQGEAQIEFQRIVAQDSNEVSERFRKPVYGLNGARGVYATHPQVRRDTFLRYVNSRNLPVEFPGVRGFGFIQQVERADLAAFIAAERADGAPDFALRQLALKDDPDLFVIKFIEPAANNQGAVGLDIGSEAVRREGVLLALETGEATTTGMVTLVQDQRSSPGVLLYVPVFADPAQNAAPDTRGPLRGLLYAPIVIHEMLADLNDVAAGRVHIEIFDTASGTASGQKMFDSAESSTPQATGTVTPEARFEIVRVIDVPGRFLTMRVRSTPAFEAAHLSSNAWVLGLVGLFASGLLAALLRQQITGRSRAERMAQVMTADLNRLALVARRTSNAVVITDAQRRIIWVNEGFERITGYEAAEVMGRSPGSFLQLEATDADTVQALRTALDAGEGFRGELLNRGKHGQTYWLDLDIQPLRDAQGTLTGFMAIESEISERKAAEHVTARERQSLQNILEGTQVGTWEWNVETGQTVLNERWAQIVGRTLAELGPTTIQTLADLTHPDDLRQSSLALEKHFDEITDAYECEVRVRHSDGHWVWALDRGKLFTRSDDGRPRWLAGTRMDITARKQAETALRANQALLGQTGRIGGVGGWELDVDTQVLSWTEETCRIHDLAPGHRPTLEEAIGYYTPESRQLIEQAVAQAIGCGQHWDMELSMVTAKGRSIWVRAVGEAEFSEGKPVRLLGAFQDITVRRSLETELRAKNDLVNSVIENLPCGLSVFDGNLNLVAANREFRRLLDFPDWLFETPTSSFESVIRFNAERGEYGDGDIETTVRQIVEKARQPMQPHQFERVRPDGTPLEIRGAPMPGGGFVTTYTDVSARKAAEAEVQRSASLLLGAIDAIDEAFVLYDPDDRLVLCNDKYRQIYSGVAHLMVPGARFEDIVRTGAEAGDYVDAIGRVDAWVAERVAVHRLGNTMMVQEHSNGRMLRIVERKMADGHIVGFRIDVTELARATEAAEKASLAKSQFLANMSHEIRTPMNAIMGMLRLLHDTGLQPRQMDYVKKTERAAKSLLGLLNDILDFSKIEAGKMTLDAQPFGLDRLLRDLSVIFSASVDNKPVEVLFDIDPRVPNQLVGDSLRLQQILINLGGNAIKFTSRGEVVLRVRLEALEGDGPEQQARLHFAMQDSGIGIAPENHHKIFADFSQAEASTTRRFGGTGLGLSISRQFIELMGGELQLHSALGHGSTFSFTLQLPVVDAKPVPDDLALPHTTGRSVLIVDDNPVARELMSTMGQSLGWAVETADSGEAALALIDERALGGKPYQVVFMDWLMPGMDGWQTSARIRSRSVDGQAAADSPVIMMVTAHGHEMLAQQTDEVQSLIDGYLVKPVTASMLFDAMQNTVPPSEADNHAPGKRTASDVTRPLAGMRLLLVEDNAINQEVAETLLSAQGAAVDIAENGLRGVEAVQAAMTAGRPYHAVLMDMQMPVMDGLTATREIRGRVSAADLPIIAMTANAMASDREACMAAGMNDHIGKPFDIDQLVALLRRLAARTELVLPGEGAPTAAKANTLPPEVQAAALAAGVELAPALQRMGGKPAVYARMLRTTVQDFGSLAHTLQQPITDADVVTAARALHTVKGLAATLGITALTQEAAAAETKLSAGPSAALAMPTCAAVGAALAAALPALSGLIERLRESEAEGAAPPTASPGKPHDPAAFHQRLTELAALLEQSDMQATELTLALRPLVGQSLGPLWEQIDDAVGSLDFERALSLCQQLLEETPSP
jgi:two-component system, sensor histidine kinase and response regulator